MTFVRTIHQTHFTQTTKDDFRAYYDLLKTVVLWAETVICVRQPVPTHFTPTTKGDFRSYYTPNTIHRNTSKVTFT